MAVQAILSHAHCAVRPGHEPVPNAISTSPAGEIFGHLVRMNDGKRHARPKLALERALSAVDLNKVAERAAFHSQQHALQGDTPSALAASLNESMQNVPVTTMAELLGFKHHQLQAVALWMEQFVSCLSPLSSATQLTAASGAATALLGELSSMVDDSQAVPGQLLHQVLAHAGLCDWNDRLAVLCNLVGLMSQTFEATAGLIGNTWVRLAREPELLASFMAWREDHRAMGLQMLKLVDEVCRFDAPIQNTRRFVTQDTVILGNPVSAGVPVLLLLGSANRDSRIHPQAHVFEWHRAPRPYFSFGHGVHACPGRALALAIAAAAISQELQTSSMQHLSSLQVLYRPSVNARMPVFESTQTSPPVLSAPMHPHDPKES
jgi:cytochrome P450